MKYTIKNDFHNSTATVIAEGLQHDPYTVEITLTKSQTKRVNRELCGIKGCTCGGVRGVQRTESGKRLIVSQWCNLRG